MSHSNRDNPPTKSTMNDKFGRSLTDRLEEEFKKTTVGLVSKDEFKKRLKSIYSESEQIRILQGDTQKPEKKKDPSKDAKQQKKKAVLSFEDDLDGDNDADKEDSLEPKLQKKKNLGKNPNVDTSFLPDKEREEKRNELRQKISEEYLKEQEKVKEHILEAKYTLWNGLNEIKIQRIRKSNTVGSFIDLCKKELDKEHVEIRQLTPDALMFVIDNCIIPYGYTFYELLASRVKGEGGVLIEDKKKEGEEGVCEQISKPIKIVDKRVYDKNKHIFPCINWKILDFSTAED